MIDIEESVYIDKPIAKVFDFTTNLNNNPHWQSNVSLVEQTSQGPFGLGATYRCVNRFLGKQFETEGFISRYEPHRICSFYFTSGGVNGESSFIFESVNGGTRFTTAAKLEMETFKIAGFIVKRSARQQVRGDLKKLKKLLENGGLKS